VSPGRWGWSWREQRGDCSGERLNGALGLRTAPLGRSRHAQRADGQLAVAEVAALGFQRAVCREWLRGGVWERGVNR
jgi:hypothetical protein